MFVKHTGVYLTMQELVGLHRESQPEESISQRLLLSTEAHFVIFMRRSADWLCGGISINPDIVRGCCGEEGTEPRCKTLIFVPLVTVNDELWVVTDLHCREAELSLRDGVTKWDGTSLERSHCSVPSKKSQLRWYEHLPASHLPCASRGNTTCMKFNQIIWLAGAHLHHPHHRCYQPSTWLHITKPQHTLHWAHLSSSSPSTEHLACVLLHSTTSLFTHLFMSFGCFLSCKFVLSLSISHSLVHPPALSLTPLFHAGS